MIPESDRIDFLFTAYCLLFIVYCLLFIVYCLLFTDLCLCYAVSLFFYLSVPPGLPL